MRGQTPSTLKRSLLNQLTNRKFQWAIELKSVWTHKKAELKPVFDFKFCWLSSRTITFLQLVVDWLRNLRNFVKFPRAELINTALFVKVIAWFLVQFGINKHELTNKIARARRASTVCGLPPIVVFLQLTYAYFFQIAREKSWDYVLIIHMKKIQDSLSQLCKSKTRASSAKIMNLFKPCVRSKQPRTIKTIICNDIFTSLGAKKFKVRLNSSRNCSVFVRITFDENESSFARFNHVCF